MAQINDINLKDWKQYDDIITDSLWLIGKRDKSGMHNNTYHGNFIPQIPNQMMRRFTKKGDVVLDPFLGHGTTLIEAKSLGRHGIGIELVPQVAEVACRNINNERGNGDRTQTEVIVTDSTASIAREKVIQALSKIGATNIDLIVLHPPYHDIIKFSDRKEDLCNAASVKEFVKKFITVVKNFSGLLNRKRYLVIVIGDKYTNSEWVPLGFYLMDETIKCGEGLRLKSVIVKNMVNNRAKLNQENLWRYRALVGGFYIFKHEYILIFQKS